MRDQSRRITFTLFFNVVLALLVLTGIDPAQSVTSEKEEILRKCGEMFQQIADPKRTIFEVDRFHLLKVEFDDHDRLKELGIVPNYYYDDDHPEWRETAEFTNLTEKEFRQLKEVLAHIKDPGKLLRAASPVSAVTNMTAWHSETYEKATFRWGEVTDLRKGDDPPIEIRWLYFEYEESPSSSSKRNQDQRKDVKTPWTFHAGGDHAVNGVANCREPRK